MMIKKTKEIAAYLTYSKKLQVLKYAKEYGNNSIGYPNESSRVRKGI